MKRLSRIIENAVMKKDWFPISISRRGPKTSHMFFVDDLILFAGANRKNCGAILTVLEEFNVASG